MKRNATTRTATAVFAAGLALASGLGCAQNKSRVEMGNPFRYITTFAVAPVLNFSGEFSLDPVKAADLLASELTGVDGVTVLPVNRVMAVLIAQGKQQIESPAHALEVADAVGADAIIVAAITEYDAYTPVVGIAMQMYARPDRSVPPLDPIAASRMAGAMTLSEMADALQPVGQVQMVNNAMHDRVRRSVERYAAPRTGRENPYGWRQYLKVQSLYLRFCWHDAIRRLLEQERLRQAVLADAGEVEVPI